MVNVRQAQTQAPYLLKPQVKRIWECVEMVIPQTYAPYLPKTHMEMILAFMYVQECIM